VHDLGRHDEPTLRLLHRRFGELPAAAIQRVRSAAPDQLDRFVDRGLTATSLADLLDG
jgi:hypothetical protein